jgi:hypothetical protein
MPGAARLRSKRSDTLWVLDNYGLPPERMIVRFGDDGEGWRNMGKRLVELSVLARRVLFLSKLALSTRQCGKHPCGGGTRLRGAGSDPWHPAEVRR